MTTLPAMSEDTIDDVCRAAGAELRHIGHGNNAWCIDGDVQPLVDAIIAARDAQWQAAVDAAVKAERERIADWYSVTGWLLDEDDVPDAIRTKERRPRWRMV